MGILIKKAVKYLPEGKGIVAPLWAPNRCLIMLAEVA